MPSPSPLAASPAVASARRGWMGWMGLCVLAFAALYCLAVVPAWMGWIRSTAKLGGAPESIFLAGMFTMFAVGVGGFILSVALGASDDEIAMAVLMLTFVLGSLVNLSRVRNSPEIQMMGAYNQAQHTVAEAAKTLGHAPPVSAQLSLPSLASAVANPAPVWEIANADADAATVSQAMSAIAATGDESDHATFVRVNAMVRPQDHEHFARLALRTP